MISPEADFEIRSSSGGYNDINSEDEADLCNDKLSVVNASVVNAPNKKHDDTFSDQIRGS